MEIQENQEKDKLEMSINQLGLAGPIHSVPRKEWFIRFAEETDVDEFRRLIQKAGPRFYPAVLGDRFEAVLGDLFVQKKNFLSHEHVVFADRLLDKTGARPMGILNSYSGQTARREGTRLALGILRTLGGRFFVKLPSMIRAKWVLGGLRHDDYYIGSIAVDPQARGQGVGSFLMEWAHQIARFEDCSRLVLDVESENFPAQRFYERLGFKPLSRKRRFKAGGQKFFYTRMIKAV